MKTKNLRFIDQEIDSQAQVRSKSKARGRHKKVSEKDIIEDALLEKQQLEHDAYIAAIEDYDDVQHELKAAHGFVFCNDRG